MLAVSRPPYFMLFCALMVSIIGICTTLFFPLLTRNLVDAFSGSTEAASATSTARFLIGTLVLGTIASGLTRYLVAKAKIIILGNLQEIIIRKLIKKDVSYFDACMTGEHVSRVLTDTGAFSGLVTDGFCNLFASIIVLVGSAIILSLLDVALAATALGIVSVAFLLMVPIGWLLSANAYKVNEATAHLTAILTQVFSEIRLIKALSTEPFEVTRSVERIRELQQLNLKSAKVFSALNPFVSLTVCAAVIAILLYGSVRVQQGTLSIGTLTAFILYIFSVIAPLFQLTGFVTQLQIARGASVRALAILNSADEDQLDCNATARLPIPERGDLTFERITFSYPERNRPTLIIPELRIREGSATALVGPSGSGKSTLFALLERFYPLDSGAIRYGGEDIQGFRLDAWRSKIGYVAQTTPMIVGSIRHNITYGLAHPSDDTELWAAADAANCADFIRALPQGLDSQIGERGVRLSGGQRQRIAIARLFVRDPAILLLDEATSNLDGEAEHVVISAIQRLMKGRTSIVATHRLDTISSVDQIIVLEDGFVTAIGDHHQLSLEGGYYHRLSARQYRQ